MNTQEEINIRTFVEGIGRVNSKNLLDLTKVSLSLLKTTPAVKDAALEFFCTLFNMAVRTYLTNIENEISTGRPIDSSESSVEEEEASVAEVHSALCSYITTNPEVWAPIVSTWSLQLLGQLSTRYAGRAHMSLDAGLSEIMNLWMGCRATRTLMDITTQCLSCLMDSDTETCISALLDSSVKHSPYFDWVVAHVGNCFPDTVITRVLSCGLKDFAQHSRTGTQFSLDKAHRLASIVGILDHLASSHFNDIRTALLELFNRSLQSVCTKDQETKLLQKVTVPYLLQLAATSSTLRKALTSNIQQTVNVGIVSQFLNHVTEWCKHFESSDALVDLIVKLALGCEQGGIQIISLLLDCSLADELGTVTRQQSRLILETILLETDSLVRSNNNVELLTSIGKDLTTLEQILIDSHELRQNTACTVVTLLGNRNPAALMLIGSFLLRKSKTDTQLNLLVKILSDNLNSAIGEYNSGCGGYLGQAIEHAIGFTTMHFAEEDELFTYVDDTALEEEKSDAEIEEHLYSHNSFLNKCDLKHDSSLAAEPYDVKAERFWTNLLKLLKWEKSEQEKINEQLSKKSGETFNIFENLLNESTAKKDSTPQDSRSVPTLLASENISRAIFHNLMEVSLIFGDCPRHPKVSNIIADLLTILNVPADDSPLNPPFLETILHLTTVTVKYFFSCCLEEDPFVRAANSNKACRLLNRLSLNVEAARTLALRELLEHALFKPQSVLFGAKFNPTKPFTDDLLLYQNLKQGSSTLMQRDSSIFHAGIIGTGIRKETVNNTIEKHMITNNTSWFINALEACCMAEFVTFGSPPKIETRTDLSENMEMRTPPKPLDGMEKIALILVEYVSSDVMYNGLPWPEEEHMKVTIERDLHIRRLFNDTPLLWELMFMLTKYPPAVCLCSVLLRALTATLLHQWSSLGNRSDACINETAKEQAHLDSLTAQTIQLLDLMSIGQLLPKPLSNIRDVIPCLTPNEVVQLLRDSVWNYMRPNEHVPSPHLFKMTAHGQFYRDPDSFRPSPIYTDTLRLTLQRNIDKLGEHFWLMFDTTNDEVDCVDELTKQSEKVIDHSIEHKINE